MNGLKGVDEAQKKLNLIAWQLSAQDSQVYKDVGWIVEQSINANFAEQGRPSWEPRKDDKTHPILDLSGRMKDDALISTRNWNVAGIAHQLLIKTPLYGLFHQYKTSRASLPVREFVKLTASEIQAITDRIRKVFGV